MPFDATHLVFAHAAAERTNPRLVRPELMAGAVAPDSVGVSRFLPMALSHLVVGRAARGLRRIASRDDPAAEAYAFGYLSHVWLDRFLARWFPRQVGARMKVKEFYALIAQRDVEEALRHWHALAPGPETFVRRICQFVDPLALGSYCAGVESRLCATPPLDDDTEAPAIFASERLKAAALEGFAQAARFQMTSRFARIPREGPRSPRPTITKSSTARATPMAGAQRRSTSDRVCSPWWTSIRR